MNETNPRRDFIQDLEDKAKEHQARWILKAQVRLGVLSPMDAEQFRENFIAASEGTMAEWAEVEIEESGDMDDPHATDFSLVSLELEG